MKSTVIIILTALVLLAAILITRPDYKWLLFNGASAEVYATALLDGKAPTTPDWAIDLVIVKKKGVVQFAEHNSAIVYAYSPTNAPAIEGVSWSHIWGAWYVGGI